jgi:altronate dehydratase small subunit
VASRQQAQERVQFLHLGDQCPYARWFASQAAELARKLDMNYDETDITGQPHLAARFGAYHSGQVHVPGHPLLAAPRAADTLLSMVEQGLPEQLAGTSTDVATSAGKAPAPPQGCLSVVGPQDRLWPDAVLGTVAVCFSASRECRQHQQVATAKRRWLEGLAARYGVEPSLAIVRLAGQVAAFAELIPVAAAHVPIAGAGPGDLFITCVHAAPDMGELRPALIGAAQSIVTSRDAALWVVSGSVCCYPNGPLDLFSAAGFAVVAGLGRVHLPQPGWDDLLLLRWSASASGAVAVGLLLGAGDNVATLPSGCTGGQTVELRGGASGPETARLEASDVIPPGHKLACQDIAAGQPVIKYGQTIGLATQAIRRGDHVHVHNLVSDRARGKGGEDGAD